MNFRKNDIYRAVILIMFAVILYLTDASNAVVVQGVGIGILLAAGSQVTRRILMPELDMQEIAKTAIDGSPIAAAVVYAAMTTFLVAVMWLSVSILS